MNHINFIIYLMLTIVLASCSSSDSPDTKVEKKEIIISAGVNAARATDTGFDSNDKIGLYVVNRISDNSAVALNTTGNHVDNMRFNYNGTWTPDTPIYWSDNTTHADFYLYYPYKSSIADVSSVSFSTKADQSTETAYKESEFLVGNKKDVAPAEAAVKIDASHVFSQMQIVLAAGNGFTGETLAAAQVDVSINGIKTNASINLTNGAVAASGDKVTVKPWLSNGVYKALIVPQTVESGNLITVNVDGRDFNLTKEFTFVGGKSHKFTVTISKTSNGINVGITGWETDNIDNGGTAE